MNSRTGFRFFPISVNIALGVLAVAAMASANPGMSLLSLLVLFILPKLVWLRGHPPLVLLCLVFQWLQTTTKLLQANLAGRPFIEYARSPEAEVALMLALAAIVVIGIGVRLMIASKKNMQMGTSVFSLINAGKLLNIYLFFFGFTFLVSGILYLIPGLTQILLSLTYVKWVFYVMLIYTILVKKEKYHYLPLIFFIEFVYNSFGYYSNFKDVVFITAIAAFTVIVTVRIGWLVLLTPFMIVIFNIFVIWNTIKEDYRAFLDSNSNVSFGQKVDKVEELYYQFEDFDAALEKALDRLSYLTMFMYTLETVPAKVPHEQGRLWVGAIQNITMPRIIFPDKKVYHDSEKANAYTGREWAGIEQGTSISIGYISESYVDFGAVLMFLPIFGLGLLVGWIYKNILSYPYHPVLLFSLVIPIIYFTKFTLIETSNDKFLGALVMNFIIFTLFIRFGLPIVLRFLRPEPSYSR